MQIAGYMHINKSDRIYLYILVYMNMYKDHYTYPYVLVYAYLLNVHTYANIYIRFIHNVK